MSLTSQLGTSVPATGRGGVGTAGPTDSRPTGTHRYRLELQGLRAVAVALVVVYHVWFGRVSGGVDVFFLISGFLLTGQLVRAVSRGGIGFRPMWGRMIKRLFPTALTVLAVVMVVSVFALPEYRWFQTIRHIVASALYLENWQLAADSADYFTRHDEAGVVQHYWSLSIQGQFYLVWPILVALLVIMARRFRWVPRDAVIGGLLVVFAASLGHSVGLTTINQPLAYFSSLTRAWEFALGGLLALCIDMVVLPRLLRLALGWLGVLGLVVCGVVLQVGSVFPGYLALWPTLCAAAVITAGHTGHQFGVDRLLSSRPLVYLGDLSYALYLWHWPVLVFYLVINDRSDVGLLGGAGIIAVSVLLSVLTHHLVEQPARTFTRLGSYRFGVIMLIPVLLAAGGWQLATQQKADSSADSVGDINHPGARALTLDPEHRGAADAPLVPALAALPRDFARIPSDCVHSPRNEDLEICSPGPMSDPDKRIVVVGDSHVHQFLAVLAPIAQRRNWHLTWMLKGTCPFSTESEALFGDQECAQWNSDAADEIIAMRPDVVVTNGSREARVGLTEETPDGFVGQWRKLTDAGIHVTALRDNPRFNFTPSECVTEKGRDAPECGVRRDQVFAADAPYTRIPNLPANVSFLDLTDYICPGQVCPPTIGNVYVYLDSNHISATYLATMSSLVEPQVVAALGS